MRYFFLMSCFLFLSSICHAQDNVVFTSDQGQIRIEIQQDGKLKINVPPQKVEKFKKSGKIVYNDFGAKGNGETDDIDAIVATHAFANLYGLTVTADDKSTYYIGGKERTASIRTDTHFGKASFIIDDTDVENRNAPIFRVDSDKKKFKPIGISSLKKNQPKLDLKLNETSLITVVNSDVKQYIRFGLNQNNGSSQTDIFVVDKNGNVDSDAPIIWDFDQITDIIALPIDEGQLKITGGVFTTIANRADSKYTYYSRNLAVRRSNTIMDGLVHYVTQEGEHGAPYAGFIDVAECAYITIKNTVLTGRKTYSTIGRAGKPVSMGSYDISVNRAVNVSFINCTQTNDINNPIFWGIMGSNFAKNLVYDNCVLSRFDAHQGVANATIKNSTLGHMGINAIGTGVLTISNSTIHGRSIVNLRSDYGSTWQGKLIIKNCVLKPTATNITGLSLINGRNSGMHDFGYVCYMPEQIRIENLKIEDSNLGPRYKGPTLFADFNPEKRDASYIEKFPYVITKEVILDNVTISSGKKLRTSDNEFMFNNVGVTLN